MTEEDGIKIEPEKLLEELEREPDSHKGENGRVGVIGGSREYTGAPALAAKAALRAGSDLVRVLTAEENRNVVASFSESMVVRSYGPLYFDAGSLQAARELDSWADALVVGPGLGESDDAALTEFMTEARSPLVVDADALEAGMAADLGEAVLTPHQGESEMLEAEEGSPGEFAAARDVVVLEKGPEDRIYTGDKMYVNGTGGPEMTVGGTGDVLAGVVASLLAQGLGPAEAARLGAWMNGKAGEEAAEQRGGLVAEDLLERLPSALQFRA